MYYMYHVHVIVYANKDDDDDYYYYNDRNQPINCNNPQCREYYCLMLVCGCVCTHMHMNP